jgi:hypothetical protein
MLRSLVARSKGARFAFRYAANLDNRYLRAAIAATDGPGVYKRRLWRRYLTPDPTFKPVALGPVFQRHLEKLREDGIVIIEGIFEAPVKRLRELVDGWQLSGYRRSDDVTDFVVDVGFAVPEVTQMLCHPELCGLLCNYYGRQAYYREHPSVVAMSAGDSGVDRTSSHVHCDGYRQLTMNLLLNDIDPGDTHLIYYRGSHKEPKLDYERVAETLNRVENFPATLGTGRAGSLILFDSGSGYHRGEYRSGQRVQLNEVVTTGWLPFKDRLREDSDVLRVAGDRQPAHVRAMFDRR